MTRPWKASATPRMPASKWDCASPSTNSMWMKSRPSSTCWRRWTSRGSAFYHLVYAGRGSKLVEDDLSWKARRKAVDLIIDRTKALHDKGNPKEVLTVDNHADGPYLYLRLLKEDPERAQGGARAAQDERGQQLGPRHRLRQLGRRGICRPVLAPPQLRQRPPAPFSEIWTDMSGRPPDEKTQGQKATSRAAAPPAAGWMSAAVISGCAPRRSQDDVWAPDPACYLTDEEIAQTI
jgi:hypothetical protein